MNKRKKSDLRPLLKREVHFTREGGGPQNLIKKKGGLFKVAVNFPAPEKKLLWMNRCSYCRH